ncbi:suppressor of fused domain protein [Streptomyces caatingaensis]|uniref:suppressor of fused domain protein n=1 Tax=Streptomyces caatingaensis TaxID=1678637 RepID=UPI000B00B981|nr:suppressor of fused domain protein [Streptomyces caatingaensis]
MNDRDTLDRFNSYRERVDALVGAVSVAEDIEPRERGDGRVAALVYAGTPGPGYVTGFTYGLSLVPRPDWGAVARELAITVRSDDVEWCRVPARIVAALRGLGPSFRSGEVFGHVGRYVADSAMNSVVLGSPVIGGAGPLDLASGRGATGEADLVEILGVYPIHATEREYVQTHGAEALWRLGWDRVDPGRPSAVRT